MPCPPFLPLFEGGGGDRKGDRKHAFKFRVPCLTSTTSTPSSVNMAEGCKLFVYGVDQNLANADIKVGNSVCIEWSVLKGSVSRDFWLHFSWIIFSLVLLILAANLSLSYLTVLVTIRRQCHRDNVNLGRDAHTGVVDTGGELTTTGVNNSGGQLAACVGVVYIGGAPWISNIRADFWGKKIEI